MDRRQVDNLITDAGKHLVANLFAGTFTGPFEMFIAVGLDGTKAEPTDTKLRDPIDNKDGTTATAVVSGSLATVKATLPMTDDGDDTLELKEAGIRITAAGIEPVLYNRVTFPVVSKSSNLEMTLSWEVTF